jgi:hypothetical protein
MITEENTPMRLTFCAACGDWNPKHLQHHHLVPRSNDGSDDETNLVTLCVKCHGVLHDRRERDYSHRERTRAGMARARAQGKHIGRPALGGELQRKIAKGLGAGLSAYAVAKQLGIDAHTVAKYSPFGTGGGVTA